VVGACVAAPAETRAQPAPPPDSAAPSAVARHGDPIGALQVVTRNIYDPLPPGPLEWAYRLANRLHIRTRPDVVRHQFLLRPGDPWNPDRAEESARQLRRLRFIDSVAVTARPAATGVDVAVETRDSWSTAIELDLQSGGGERVGMIGLTENNLLGFGKYLSLSYRETSRNVARSLIYQDPGVLGSRWILRGRGTDESQGAITEGQVGLPFYAEDAPASYLAYGRREARQAELFEADELAAQFDVDRDEVEVQAGRGVRLGTRILRGAVRFNYLDRRYGPATLEPGASPGFAGGEESLRLRRLAGEISLWRPTYTKRYQVDHLDRLEDIDLGLRGMLQLGWSPEAWGSSEDEGFAAARLGLAHEFGPAYWLLDVRGETRIRSEPLESVVTAEGRVVHQGLPRQTWVLAAWSGYTYRPARDFQFLIGGLNGLRGFDAQEVSGEQVVRFNLEDRVMMARHLGQVVSLGMVGFADLARGWGLGSAGQKWHFSTGFGLRASFPRSGWSRVARFDVAWPLQPGAEAHERPVFSIGTDQAF
jgi:hypothetical protein